MKSKVVRISEELIIWLQTINPDINLALYTLKGKKIDEAQATSMKIRISDLETNIEQVQEVLSKIINFNKLKH